MCFVRSFSSSSKTLAESTLEETYICLFQSLRPFCFKGKRCSSTAFKKELSCPLCDTVLPKDGIGAVTLLPDANEIGKAGSKTFGFEPEQMCEVLKLGLDFWVKQKENESLLHARELKGVQKRMAELEEQNARLSRVCLKDIRSPTEICLRF